MRNYTSQLWGKYYLQLTPSNIWDPKRNIIHIILCVCLCCVCSCEYILRSYKTQRSLLISHTQQRHISRLRRLFSSIRIALTLHGTKSNSVLSLNELAGEAVRLDCIWGMLIYLESGFGDVVIKDSISQRSVWCDHILPLTDGVSLTSALWWYGCHKRPHQHTLTRNRESGGYVRLNIPVRVKNSFSHGVLK